jgi:hypothetical protein
MVTNTRIIKMDIIKLEKTQCKNYQNERCTLCMRTIIPGPPGTGKTYKLINTLFRPKSYEINGVDS